MLFDLGRWLRCQIIGRLIRWLRSRMLSSLVRFPGFEAMALGLAKVLLVILPVLLFL